MFPVTSVYFSFLHFKKNLFCMVACSLCAPLLAILGSCKREKAPKLVNRKAFSRSVNNSNIICLLPSYLRSKLSLG